STQRGIPWWLPAARIAGLAAEDDGGSTAAGRPPAPAAAVPPASAGPGAFPPPAGEPPGPASTSDVCTAAGAQATTGAREPRRRSLGDRCGRGTTRIRRTTT